jgi:hypothetical protein
MLLVLRRTRFVVLGIVCGAGASFVVQVALMTMFFVGGGS